MEEKKPMHTGKIKIDRTLLELCAGIVFWGVLCQTAGVFFVRDKAGYSTGLWYGALTAVLSGIHMWWTLDRSLDFAQDTAVKMMTKYNILRYVFIVLAMALVMITGFASPLSAFLGLMGLKLSAYIQPFTHKLLCAFEKGDRKHKPGEECEITK